MLKKLIIMACFLVSTIASAEWDDASSEMNEETQSRWRFIGGVGASKTKGMYGDDGDGIYKRIAIAMDTMSNDTMTFSIELGAQDGQDGRLDATAAQQSDLGGPPVQMHISQMADILFNAEFIFGSGEESFNALAFVKAGLAYRNMNFDRESVNSVSQFSPEFQIGFGFEVGRHMSIGLGYQGIFSGNVELTTNGTTQTGTVKNIPSMQGLMATFTYHA
jgi:hypothetical protein